MMVNNNHGSGHEERTRRVRPVESPNVVRRDAPVKKLFDPDVHDPVHFHPRATAPEGSSRVRRSAGTAEEEGDRERERRRRREGGEKGSAGSSRKKEGDARSRGSRSSEGSESLRDRERGKGKRWAVLLPRGGM